MACKYRGGEKEEWQMESLCRFHRFELSMPKGPISQIEAVKRLTPSSNSKEVQVLTGILTALNQFISKLVDRCCPFYQLLKKWGGF